MKALLLLWLWSTGSEAGKLLLLGHMGSAVVVHGLSCPAARGIFPDPGSNSCALLGRRFLYHWTTRQVPQWK